MNSPDTLAAAAGWYPDPEHGGWFRYWDGTNWTEQRRPAAAAGDAATPAPPAGARRSGAAGVVLIGLGLLGMPLGLGWIVVYYMTQNGLPLPALGGANVLVGLAVLALGVVALIAGIVVAISRSRAR